MNFFKNRRNIIVILVFLTVATGTVFLSDFLPKKMTGDEVVTLLVHKSSQDQNYPDRELISSMDHSTYFYHRLVGFLSDNFSTDTYEKILLFTLVFLTSLGVYLALRFLRVSWLSSLMVSLIALMPRMSPGQTFFGILTDKELSGRALALPFIWILSALNIKFLSEEKDIWPIFFLAGFLVYIHPVSMVFFTALLFLINFIILFKKHNLKIGAKQIIYGLIAWLTSGIFLVVDIISNVFSSLKNTDQVFYTGFQYAEALFFRMPWDFYRQQILWLRHVGISTFFFIIFIIFMILILRKKKYQWSDRNKIIFLWACLLIIFSIAFSFIIPNGELYLVKNFDWPFIIQQSSRIFKFYYLGLFIIFAVFFDLFRKYFTNKILLSSIFIIGIFSSGFGFEWAQYLAGYQNYQKEYIPATWQNYEFDNKEEKYSRICQYIKEVGIGSQDLVISYDFNLRYFCALKLYTTFEEGTFYLMRGKNDLVYWHQIFQDQKRALDNKEFDYLISLANKIGAKYTILNNSSPLINDLPDSGLLYYDKGDIIIVEFNK